MWITISIQQWIISMHIRRGFSKSEWAQLTLWQLISPLLLHCSVRFETPCKWQVSQYFLWLYWSFATSIWRWFTIVHSLWHGERYIHIGHDDVIKWNHSPRYWPIVRGSRRSPVDSPHKGQWREAVMFSLILTWTNGGANNRDAGDLRRHGGHFDVTVMAVTLLSHGYERMQWIYQCRLITMGRYEMTS